MNRKSLRARLMLVVSPVVAVAFCGGNQAGADVIFVDLNSEAPSPDGLSWPGAFSNLHIALAVCGLDPGDIGTEIWVKNEGYFTSSTYVLPDDCQVYGGFAGDESQRDQRDWKANVTTLDGGNSIRVVQRTSTGGGGTVLDGFTVQNGHSNLRGGGILLDGGELTVRNCTIRDNFASLAGGGIGLFGNTSHLLIIDSVISNNNGDSGGGIGGKGNSGIDCFNTQITGKQGVERWRRLF